MISVIIPVYNLENYIERTLDSVCAQTYKNLEIIVVDDGSTDNSLNLIKEYAKTDARIICISQKNTGVTSARLNGVKHAHGEWIGFADGDDEIEPDMFEFLISNTIKYESDISHCGYKMVFDDGRINQFYGSGQIIEQDTNTGLRDLLHGNPVEPSLCNKLFKKHLFDCLADFNFDISIKNNEDLLMNYLLFSQSSKSVFIDECKYNYMVRHGSASRSINKNTIYDPIKVKEIILDISNDNLKPDAQRALLSTLINTYSSLVSADHSLKSDYKKIRKKIGENKQYYHLLSRNCKILFLLILYCPLLFNPIYKIYGKYFQKRMYE